MRLAKFTAACLFAFICFMMYPWNAHVVAADSDANLISISQDLGALSPAFSPDITEYWMRMKSSDPQFYTAGTLSNTGAILEYKMNSSNWTAIADYTSTGHLATNRGDNTFQFRVTATDGITVKTYTIHVYYPNISDADLLDLRSGNMTLSPAFQSSTTSYTASVPYATASVQLTATFSDGAANELKINNNNAVSGSPFGPVPLNVGANTISIFVKSNDQSSSRTYTVTVTRAAASTNANLSDLTLSGGPLSPVFIKNQTSYSLSDVGYAVDSLTVTPTTEDAAATVKVRVNGGSYESTGNGTASSSLPLQIGSNTIDVQVTAQNESATQTYTITVKRLKGDAALASLAVSPGSLNETFASGTLTYTMAAVGYNTDSLSITPVLSDPTGAFVTVQVNYGSITPVTSGHPISVQLPLGSNTIHVNVLAEDTSIIKNYTITVTRLNNDIALTSLAVSPGNLNETFASSTLYYTMAAVGYNTDSLEVTPVLSDPTGATVSLQVFHDWGNNNWQPGASVSGTSGSPISAQLPVGDNNIYVKVTAADPSISGYYVISVKRLSNDDALTSLAVSPGSFNETFASGTLSYTMPAVGYDTEWLTITPTLSDPTKAFVSVQGYHKGPNNDWQPGSSFPVTSGYPASIQLPVGDNMIHVKVLAEDSSVSRTYTIAVRRLNGDASLSSLTVSPGNLNETFASGRLSYTMASVSNTTYTLSVTPVLSDSNATSIRVQTNGGGYMPLSGGHANVQLAPGFNLIQIEVVAEDNTRSYTYTIVVDRQLSSENTLADLAVSSGTLVFSPLTQQYSLTVSRATYEISVRPTLAANNTEAFITVRINGGFYYYVANGANSPALSLLPGIINTVEVLVTAQNGSPRLYTIAVSQAGTPALQYLAIEGMQAKLMFSEPLLSSVTDVTYYSIYNITRGSALTVTQIVYTPGSPEVRLNMSGLLLPGDQLQFQLRADAVSTAIGGNDAMNLSFVFGTPLQQLQQRLAELDTDHNGIHINEIVAYLNSTYGRIDLNGDGVFDREDVAVILRQMSPVTAPSAGLN
ncbi:cadherin-like beta sandwich domain-containing protein [Paenibacillus thalictri]|uniref:Cadherin-like beta sandwich domain-containing protein n=1 Tax=Paenibacillus thalictri TaxID=2527873 RepID=A0A4Q9DRV4_9BACL|nr:cadherin-like beta sandwich domain-containing protein [Paenibacillus thalictri]TBL79547.1 cadherin-like beta sandwich domain-containing protein [Paenibacillus thalictri]